MEIIESKVERNNFGLQEYMFDRIFDVIFFKEEERGNYIRGFLLEFLERYEIFILVKGDF